MTHPSDLHPPQLTRAGGETLCYSFIDAAQRFQTSYCCRSCKGWFWFKEIKNISGTDNFTSPSFTPEGFKENPHQPGESPQSDTQLQPKIPFFLRVKIRSSISSLFCSFKHFSSVLNIFPPKSWQSGASHGIPGWITSAVTSQPTFLKSTPETCDKLFSV